MRTKILFAIPALDRAGPDRVLFELLTAIDRDRFTPSLLVSEPDGHYLSQLPSDIHVEVLGTQKTIFDRYPVARALRAVRRLQPDVVFATLRMTMTLGLASLGFPRRTRLVLRQANDVTANTAELIARSPLKHRLSRRFVLETLRRADAIICQSEAMKRDLGQLLGDSRKLHAIHNPIDVAAVRRKTATPVQLPGKPALVSAGRLGAQKGYDILLPAIAELRATHPEVHVTVFGEGPDREQLLAQSTALGLTSHVTFAGFHPDPLPSVAGADLFVLASRYEGFPNAALEALAAGVPVVLTDCPGANSKIVLPGINGRLAPAIEPGSMARAIERALADRYDPAVISADTEQRFGARRIAAAYEVVFDSVKAIG